MALSHQSTSQEHPVDLTLSIVPHQTLSNKPLAPSFQILDYQSEIVMLQNLESSASNQNISQGFVEE